MCGFNVRFHQSPKTADRRFTQWEGRFSRTGVGDRDHSVVRKTQSLTVTTVHFARHIVTWHARASRFDFSASLMSAMMASAGATASQPPPVPLISAKKNHPLAPFLPRAPGSVPPLPGALRSSSRATAIPVLSFVSVTFRLPSRTVRWPSAPSPRARLRFPRFNPPPPPVKGSQAQTSGFSVLRRSHHLVHSRPRGRFRAGVASPRCLRRHYRRHHHQRTSLFSRSSSPPIA